jgi:hypothetical protein
MEKSAKRGKIPQSDWPLIMARYEAGETLSSIARTYDCSPPAISYIVSRSRGKPTSDSSVQPATEPQLVKSTEHDTAANGSVTVEPIGEQPAPVSAIRREVPIEARTVTPASGTTVSGDQRRTLHLSLGNGSDNGHGAPALGSDKVNGNGHDTATRPAFVVPRSAQPQNGVDNDHHLVQPPQPTAASPEANHNSRDLFAIPDGRRPAQQPRDADAVRRDNSAFIDQELRTRVDGDIAAFLAAFDAALAADTQESRFGLREATDRLLRAGARTRIELERLEARVPLPGRDGARQPDPGAWRYR